MGKDNDEDKKVISLFPNWKKETKKPEKDITEEVSKILKEGLVDAETEEDNQPHIAKVIFRNKLVIAFNVIFIIGVAIYLLQQPAINSAEQTAEPKVTQIQEGNTSAIQGNVVNVYQAPAKSPDLSKKQKAYIEEVTGASTPLTGKAIVFTGELDSMIREKARELSMKAGAVVRSDVTSKVDYLVVGKNPGSKVMRARNHNVAMLTEKEWLDMLTDNPEAAFSKSKSD